METYALAGTSPAVTVLHPDWKLQAHEAMIGLGESHLLPGLPGQVILALRNACQGWRAIVDGAPLSAVQRQCEALLPSGLHGTAANSPHLYSLVLAQAAVVAAVHDASRVTLHEIPTPSQIAEDALWQPVLPVQYLALVMRSAADPSAPTVSSKEVILVSLPSRSPSPGPHPDSHPATIMERVPLAQPWSWAVWCRGGSHLVFEEVNTAYLVEPCEVHIAVLDVFNGSLSSVGFNLQTVAGWAPSTLDWVSPNRDALLVPSMPGRNAALLVLSLPSLQPVSHLPGPGRGIDTPCGHADEKVPRDWHKMVMHMLKWSPTGAHVAILWDSRFWREIAAPELHIFSLLNLRNVHLMRQSVPLAKDGNWDCSWSPSGSELLTCRSEAGEDGVDDVRIVSPTGDCQTVILPEDMNYENDLSWSACGKYLNGVHEEFGSKGDSVTATTGFIWDLKTRQTCFTWHADCKDRLLWSCKGNKCLVPSRGVILTMPGNSEGPECGLTYFGAPGQASDMRTTSLGAGNSSSSSQRSGMHHLTSSDNLGFSPCGNLVVGCWQMQHGPGTFRCSGQAPETDSSPWQQPRQRPWQLWHGKCDETSDALNDICSMQSVAASNSEFRMTRIAFHPHPSCHRIYAIADTDCSLHLMDGYAHRRLRLWTWQQLSQQLEEASEKQTLQLKWSWDGAQLAVLAMGLVVLIAF